MLTQTLYACHDAQSITQTPPCNMYVVGCERRRSLKNPPVFETKFLHLCRPMGVESKSQGRAQILAAYIVYLVALPQHCSVTPVTPRSDYGTTCNTIAWHP
jgi:hypothetical protein